MLASVIGISVINGETKTPTATTATPLVTVDEKLTAEEVFAANFKGDNLESMVRGLIHFSDQRIDWRKLSKTESEKYQQRIHAGELADLMLLKTKCTHPTVSEIELDKVQNLFDELPEDLKTEALDHENAAIQAREDDPKAGLDWFCSVMNRAVIRNYYDELVRPYPALELAIGMGLNGVLRPGMIKAPVRLTNRTQEKYSKIVWTCTLYWKRSPVGRTQITFEKVSASFESYYDDVWFYAPEWFNSYRCDVDSKILA